MRKLNVDFTEADKPKDTKRLDVATQWASPVGWWCVTTEGDCEGRSTADLGQHYGHVADIAFELANKCEYSLRFRPRAPGLARQREVKRTATKRKVNVSFTGGPFEGQSPNVKDFYNWLDVEGVNVTKSNFYGAIELEALK